MEKCRVYEYFGVMKAEFSYFCKEATKKQMSDYANLWCDLLEEYDGKLVDYAFREAMKVAKVPLVPADIIEQIEKLQSATEASDGELWDKALQLIYDADDLVSSFHFTALDRNGKTQGENARIKLNKLWENSDSVVKEFFGSVGNLISVAKGIGEIGVAYEKARFYKQLPGLKQRVKSKKAVNKILLEGTEIKLID